MTEISVARIEPKNEHVGPQLIYDGHSRRKMTSLRRILRRKFNNEFAEIVGPTRLTYDAC